MGIERGYRKSYRKIKDANVIKKCIEEGKVYVTLIVSGKIAENEKGRVGIYIRGGSRGINLNR